MMPVKVTDVHACDVAALFIKGKTGQRILAGPFYNQRLTKIGTSK